MSKENEPIREIEIKQGENLKLTVSEYRRSITIVESDSVEIYDRIIIEKENIQTLIDFLTTPTTP